MAEEYYVRPANSDTARGPYDIDKLNTLAEAGQITRETLYYDDDLESWAAIGSNKDLAKQIFPDKRKLQLKSSEKAGDSERRLSRADDEREAVSVENMLAAAEGTTEETAHLREKIAWQNRAASLAIPTLAAVCLVSALTYIYPSISIVKMLLNNDPNGLSAVLQHPLLVLGVLDLIFAICLALAATEIYPLLRFRAMLGAGFFGVVYWSQYALGHPPGLILVACVLAYGIGVYICTLTLNFRLMVGSVVASLAGALGFAYFTTFAPLLGG
jgi:hypothetical protein